MSTITKIEWCHHTFNPWRGCTKVSEGCAHCYAETMSKRNPKTLGVWGPQGVRTMASPAYWAQPDRWNADAKRHGERRRVFCASLADVGEGPDTMPAESWDQVQMARVNLSKIIERCDWLDFLLLTKRPQNMPLYFPEWVLKRSWVGTSCENQQTADERITHLLRCPAAVRFVSAEPLLGPIKLIPEIGPSVLGESTVIHDRIGWVIVGGESGPKARPCDVAWIRSIRDQCKASGVACFVKQIGARPIFDAGDQIRMVNAGLVDSGRRDPKGGSMEEWPSDLRIREFPQ